jgi:hypothetical protein
VDFLVLPPEINSARMYAGAGAGPMFGAAAAWDGLAADLAGSAASFDSVISALARGFWLGSASLSMAGAAAPYVAWLTRSAAQAALAGAQARAAATAFEAARTATVHPVAVTTNRTALVGLVATNILGQNTPAIFENEFHYVEMWAQDVAAMVGYHAGALSVASLLAPFSGPPAALAGMASEAGDMGMQAGGDAVSQALTTVSSAVQLLSMPLSAAISPLMSLTSLAQGANAANVGTAVADAALPEAAKFAGAPDPKPLGAGGLGGAGLGKARLVGAMSVPPTWQGSMPARMATGAVSGLGAMPNVAEIATAAGTPAATGLPMMPMPMGGGAGGGMPGGAMGRGGASPHVAQNRPSVVPRSGVG